MTIVVWLLRKYSIGKYAARTLLLTIIDGSKGNQKDTDSVVYIIFSGLKYVKNQTIVIIDLIEKGNMIACFPFFYFPLNVIVFSNRRFQRLYDFRCQFNRSEVLFFQLHPNLQDIIDLFAFFWIRH
jgi:hypothetical protein